MAFFIVYLVLSGLFPFPFPLFALVFSLRFELLDTFFRVGFLLGDGFWFLFVQRDGSGFPVLFNLPLCPQHHGFGEIEDLFGLPALLVKPCSPFPVTIAVDEEPQVVFSRVEVEEVRTVVHGLDGAHHLVAVVHQLHHHVGVGHNEPDEQCSSN